MRPVQIQTNINILTDVWSPSIRRALAMLHS
jgi:hypothetical protein